MYKKIKNNKCNSWSSGIYYEDKGLFIQDLQETNVGLICIQNNLSLIIFTYFSIIIILSIILGIF